MYNDFYGFQENPFNITADPGFFFPSQRHEDAFSNLIYGIQHRKGILVITGEIGTGKTTLCRALLARLQSNIKTALVLNPYFSDLQLLQFIVKDLGIQCKYKSKLDLVQALNNFLIVETTLGNNVVLIIDEAQNLKINQLEQIRLLSNLETEKEKLLQIILVGQPELQGKLQLPSLRQLNQRIAVRFHIQPLTAMDIKPYIEHRLNTATRQEASHSFIKKELTVHFSDKAINAIYHWSQGTPRVVNIICDRALLYGYVHATNIIDETVILNACQEIGIIHEHHSRSPEKSTVKSLPDSTYSGAKLD